MKDTGDKGDGDRNQGKFDGDRLTQSIIEAVIRVHTELGPGFDEKIYHNAMIIELSTMGLQVNTEKSIVVRYRSHVVGTHRPDLVVDEQVVIELKVVDQLTKRYYRQLKSYLKAANLRVGLLVNFDDDKADFRRVEFRPSSPQSPHPSYLQ